MRFAKTDPGKLLSDRKKATAAGDDYCVPNTALTLKPF